MASAKARVSRPERHRLPAGANRAGRAAPADTLLDLVRLRVAQKLQCETGTAHYTSKLQAAGESLARLNRVENWRVSLVFDPRERTALALAELLARPQAEESQLLPHLLQEAQHILSRAEIIRIVIAIEALCDWKEVSLP